MSSGCPLMPQEMGSLARAWAGKGAIAQRCSEEPRGKSKLCLPPKELPHDTVLPHSG